LPTNYDENGNVRPDVVQKIKNELAIIRTTAQKNEIYLKAPSGRPSNLKAGAWELVRTKRFKNWFGDWESASIIRQARNAWNDGSSTGKYSFASSEKLAVALKELLGHDVENIVITDSAVRHIKKHHGGQNEGLRGQVTLTPEDIAVLPYVINNFDTIERSEDYDDRMGNKALKLSKQINGITVVTTIERGESKNFVVSSWIAKKTGALDAQSAPGLNVRNDPAVLEMVKHDIEKIKSSFDSSSKVVDENGEPLVVYHGTGTPDITEFKRTKATDKNGRMMALGEGKGKFYFTASRNGAQLAAAGAVARGQGKSATVMPVLLNLRNPISLSEYRARYQTLSGHGLNEGYSGEYTSTVRDKYIAQLDKAIRKEGFDGISDSENGYYIAFEPNQIKSVDNRGTFDAGENIFYQPVNAGIDLNEKVTGVVVTPTLTDAETSLIKKSGDDRSAFLARIAGKYRNADTQWEINLSNRNIDHALNSAMAIAKEGGLRYEDQVQILAGLPQIIQNAKLIESHKDRHENSDVKQVHRMYCPVRLTTAPDAVHIVKLTVKEYGPRFEATVEGIYRAYDAKIAQTKKTPDVKRATAQGGTLNTSDVFSMSIREMLEGVNDNAGNPFIQNNTLIATHGIDVSALEKAFANFDGQLPMPSLAIGRRGQQGATHYGEIMLIGDKNMIDPQQNSLTDVYDTDMWSPTVPRPEYKLDRAKRKAMTEIVNTTFSKWSDYKTDAYEIRYRLGADDSTLDDIVRSAAQKIPFRAEYISQVLGKTPQIVRDEQGSIDDSASRLALLEQFRDLTGHDSSAYDKWVESQFRQLAGEALVKVGRKMLPYTAENVLEAMRKKGKLASEDSMFFGSGKVRAKGAKKLTSIEAMHKAEGQLATKQDFEMWKEQVGDPAFKDAHSKLTAEMTRTEKAKGYEPNPFDMLDEAAHALANFISGKKSLESVTGIADLSEETKAAAQKYKDVLAQAKTEYFEAKPRRLVDVSEFRAAVVPASTPAELRQKLEERGIRLYEYPDGDQAARQQIAEHAAQEQNVFFQNAARQTVDEEVQTQIEAVKRRFENTPSWLKAPNGEKSNLSERQWLLVRTRNFLRWFGNWTFDGEQEIEAVDLSEYTKIIDESGNEVDLTTAKTKDIKNWLSQQYLGKTVEINSDGSLVGFDKNKLSDSLKLRNRASNDFQQHTPYALLDKIIENSVYLSHVPVDQQTKHKGLLGQDIYLSVVQIGAKNYAVKLSLDVEQTTRNVNYKGHKIAGIKIEPLTVRVLSEENSDYHARSSSKFILNDVLNNVKNGAQSFLGIAAPFEHSALLDKNGEPKVMYHGTPNGTFAEFRPGAYFSSEQQYADRYQNPSASSISTGKQALNPKTFAVFLDIKKPFDLSDPEARRIYIEEYVKGGNAIGINPYLSDEEYAKIADIDWTEGEDLKEFLQENGYDYDGIRLNEGGDPDGNGGVTSRGDSYLVFNPEQIKSVDNRGSFDESANIYNQDRNEPQARGYIEFGENGESIIGLLKDADQSTFIHEMGHMMLGNLVAFGQTTDGTVQVRTDWQPARLTAALFVCAVPSIMGMCTM